MSEEVYIKIPWWIPPSNAEWFDLVEDAPIIDTDGEVTLINFKLPVDQRAVIRWFGQEVCDVTKRSKENLVTWRIKVNNGPDKVYGYVKGIISTIKAPTETLIRIPTGKNFQLTVNTTSTTALDVIGRLKGWYWSK